MADMSTPIKNTAFTLSFTLYKNDGTIVANPGTYVKKVSVDGGAVADIAASVTEEDTTYGQLSLVLATGEMNGDVIWVYVTDDTAGTVPFTCSLYPAAGNAYAEALAVKGDTAATLADTGELQTDWANGGRLDLLLDGASAPSAATVADAVWDEALSGHATGGSSGAALTGAGSAGDPWTTSLPGAYGAGTAGALVGSIPEVKADTDSLIKGRYNRNDTDPITGDETVYEDDSTTVHKSGPIYEDIAGAMPFDGSGANRRDRMT